jgi:uncharacterized protein
MNQILDNQPFESLRAQTIARQFFARVYLFMFAALLISGTIAYQFGTIDFIAKYFITEAGKISPLFYVVVFSPIGVAFVMQRYVNRLSFPLLFGLFALYSLLLGFSLTTIFLMYDLGSIISTFFITAGAFAAMAILGYTTKLDLTGFGSLLYMAFIGIFIAGIVNFFLESEMVSYVISIIGVFVFTGLTAYHMQKLKEVAFNTAIPESDRNKLALIGGFQLYVLFVNLFMSLLRLLGSRD